MSIRLFPVFPLLQLLVLSCTGADVWSHRVCAFRINVALCKVPVLPKAEYGNLFLYYSSSLASLKVNCFLDFPVPPEVLWGWGQAVWAQSGRSLAQSGAVWRSLGAVWRSLEQSGSSQGAVWEQSGCSLAAVWAQSGRSLAQSGAVWRSLGAVWAQSGAVWAQALPFLVAPHSLLLQGYAEQLVCWWPRWFCANPLSVTPLLARPPSLSSTPSF